LWQQRQTGGGSGGLEFVLASRVIEEAVGKDEKVLEVLGGRVGFADRAPLGLRIGTQVR